jgi:hypothetical protein
VKILRLLAIVGFVASVFGHIISFFTLNQTFPWGGFPILGGMTVLGVAGIVACGRIGTTKGVWGRSEQWKYIKSRCPEWANRVVKFLFVYYWIAFIFLVVLTQAFLNETWQNLNPFFFLCISAMLFYFFVAMTFYATEEITQDKLES